MNFDDVGRIWREEVTGDFARTRVEYLSAATDRAAKLDAYARRLGWLWTFTAIVAVPYFSFFAIWGIRGGYLVATLGLIIVAISIVIMTIRIRRIRGVAPDPTLPVIEAVRAQVARLLALERFHGTVEWYLGPLVAGVLVVAAGSSLNMAGDPVSLGLRVRISILWIVLSGVVVFGQRRRARVDVRPLREELESWIADLKDSDLEGVSDAR